jgi:uncharacterized hydrophobic protein (TIGR00341 family)
MPLRLLEFMLDKKEFEDLPGQLEDIQIVQIWMTGTSDTKGMVRILHQSENTEALSDKLSQLYEVSEDFRLILLPVEAAIPPVEPPEEKEEAEPDEKEKAKKRTQRISREELYEDLTHASRLTPVYAITVALSAIVAAIGLVSANIPIIIGAMLIAPLLGPNVALGLASALGDLDLARRSLLVIVVGIAIGIALSSIMGVFLHVDVNAPEIAIRTKTTVSYVVVALAAGSAGTLAFTGGIPAVVVGVMVAVALLPPLVVTGLLIGSGNWLQAAGAFVLLMVNITCINLAAVATFLLQRVRPRTWWEAERAKRATRVAIILWVAVFLILLVLLFLVPVGAL